MAYSFELQMRIALSSSTVSFEIAGLGLYPLAYIRFICILYTYEYRHIHEHDIADTFGVGR